MGYFIIGGIVFIMVCIAYGLGGGLLYLIYLPFKKRMIKNGRLTRRNSRLINSTYVSLILLIAIFSTWTAFFPMNGFYRDEFENNTGLEFPDSGKIIAKDSEYPDLHGDYWATAIFEVNELDFKTIKTDLQRNKNFQVDTTSQRIGITREFDELTKGIKEDNIEIVYFNKNKEWVKVAFMNDGKTIIFERSSS